MTMGGYDYKMGVGVLAWGVGSQSTLYNAVTSDTTLGKAVNYIREVLDVVSAFSKKMGQPIAVTSAIMGICVDLANIDESIKKKGAIAKKDLGAVDIHFD